MENISLGKNGKIGKLNLSRIKAGITKEDVAKIDKNLESVFDKVDVNKDGTLDRSELDTLKEQVSSWAGVDENLEKNEINDARFASKKDKKALLNFLKTLDGVTPEDVVKAETQTLDGQTVEVVTFKDNHTETFFPDGKTISKSETENKKTEITKQNGKFVSEVVTENEGQENQVTSTTTLVNGQKQTVIENKGEKTTTTITYNGEKKDKAVVVGETSTSVITYGEDEKPAKEVETSGTTEKTYTYNGEEKVLMSEIQNKGIEGKEIHKIYDKDGGYTQTQNVGSGVITTVADKDGNVTSCKKTETINGQEVSLQLDNDGNIPGVIVQNGESLSTIAKKFGCSVDDLVELNQDQLKGKGKNKYFDVGSEIKLPNTVSIEKFQKAQEGRKPAEVAKAEYARDAEIRRQKAEAEKQEREYYKQLGVINFDDKGKKVKAEGWGDREFEVIGGVGYGRQLVKYNGKLYTRSHDGKILREDYLEAHKAYVSKPKNQRNNTVSGQEGVTYVKDSNGKVWYFDEKTGKAIIKDGYNKIVKQESAFIANQLHTAADDIGTDNELLAQGVKNIYSADILAGVNAELRTKDSDYDVDVQKSQMMPVEALILDENNHKSARPLLQTLIESGAMSVEEQARTIKREMEYELAGDGKVGIDLGRVWEHFEFGTSYTSTADLNSIMQMATSREVRLEIENQYKNDPQFANLEPNEGSYVRARIGIDGGLMNWNAQEVDQFDANWIKSGAYAEATYDSEGNLIDAGDQEHRNAVVDRLVFGYQNKEALNKGLEVINDDPYSADYIYLDARAGEEVAKDPDGKYQARFTDQDNIQRYLAGFHSDETGRVDAGNVSASNTLLFKGVKPTRIQAEEALYDAKIGDYSKTFDSMEEDTYSIIAELVANGDIAGVKDINDLYKKAYAGTTDANEKIKIKANAMISGQVNFSDKEKAELCIELMHSIDRNRGNGVSSNGSGSSINISDYQTEQLKNILQNNPQIIAEVKAQVEKGEFSYTTTTQEAESLARIEEHDSKGIYRQLLQDSKTIAQEEIFYDENGKQVTDPKQIQQIKNLNMQSLEQMRKYVAELEREFKKGADAQGGFSRTANSVATNLKFGTNRGEVENQYRNAKLMLKQFEAAAQGRLRDSQGKVVSAQDLAKQMLDKQNALAKTNSDYTQTVEYTKMGIILAPVIVATGGAGAAISLAGGGTIAVAVGSGIAAGATSYGVNALEYNTSYTGNTAEAREQNLQDSLVNGATTAIGIAQMKYIGGMANNLGTVGRTSVRLGTTVAADTTVGAAAEGITTGNVSSEGLVSNMVMSGVGNVIGAKSLGKKQPTPKAHPKEGILVTHEAPVTGRNEIADAEVARNIDQSHLNAKDRAMIAREMEAQGTPTPAELEAYAKEHAYQAPTAEERAALDAHQEQVRADYADAHKIENNAVVKEQKKPTPVSADNANVQALENEIKSFDGQISMLKKRIFGAKKMGKNTAELEKQLQNLQTKRSTKSAELDAVKNPVNATPEVKPSEEVEVKQPVEEKSAIETPSVESKEVINDINSIPEAQIPAQHRSLWKSCKAKIESLMQELQMPSILNFKELSAKGRAVLDEIKTISNSCGAEMKTQLRKLSDNIKQMLNNAKKQLQNTNTKNLSAKQKESVYALREIYHSELDDISYLRSEYPQYNYMSDKELLDFFKLDEKHASFVKNRKDLFANGDAKYMERAYWNDSPYELTNNHSAWKMHLFSVDELDYQQMAEVVLPYLNKHKIAHKTLSSTMSPELLSRTAPEQTGKAFTIYPQSQEEMAKIAKDLDRLIREHNLTTNSSHITGDNQLGDSGRLFYRYEFKTGKLKDRIYTPDENNLVHAAYDGNRGEGQYLANDMTPADDPWLNFDPSNPNSVPGQKPAQAIEVPINSMRQPTPQERMEMGQIGNNINRAKTPQDIANAQQWLNKMPECPQKARLQAQLEQKANAISVKEVYSTPVQADYADVEIMAVDYSNYLPGSELPKGQNLILGNNSNLNLAGVYEIDLNSSEISAKIKNLKPGESLTIGRSGDIKINDPSLRVSNKHLEIQNIDGQIVVKDISTNGTSISNIRNISMNPIEQSKQFNRTHKIDINSRVADGYKDGGRGLRFDDNGRPINTPSREIILVDRKKDVKLQNIVSDVKRKAANLNEKEKAAFLQKYVCDIFGGEHISESAMKKWVQNHVGQEVLLGDIVASKPSVGVCRHRSLLYKILGDELGLKVELQRGNFYSEYGGGGHAWNTVTFSDGTTAIYDAMHNKTSNITPGYVDKYAEQYYTVNDELLYQGGKFGIAV